MGETKMIKFLKHFTLFVFVPLFIVSGASAGEDLNIDKGVNQIFGEVRNILSEYMAWSDEEKKLFWPAYDNYEKDLRRIFTEIMKVILKYDKESHTISKQEAKTLANRYLSLRIEKIELWKSFVMNLYEILPHRKLLRLIEVERQIEIGFDLRAIREMHRSG
jgi:hypothetical protein